MECSAILKKFVILGFSNGGLFMARQLRREWPDSVIFALGMTNDIGRYSNVVNRFYSVTAQDSLLKIIEQAYQEIGKGDVKAVICSNPMLEDIVLNYPEVFDLLHFDNPIQTYTLFVSKEQTNRLCENLNVNFPGSYKMADIDGSVVDYPIVAKPIEKTLTHGVDKIELIKNIEQFQSYISKLTTLGVDRDLIVFQQYIHGNNKWEYGYGGYFENGHPIIDICFYQIRQMPQGICCYTKEITNDVLVKQIREFVNPILDYTHYCGFIEFDIKQDEDTKSLYLLDINPRPWRSSDMLSGKVGKSTIFRPKPSDNAVAWCYPFKALSAHRNKMNPSKSECRKIKSSPNEKFVVSLYDRKDIKPFIMQGYTDAKTLVSKLLKVFS